MKRLPETTPNLLTVCQVLQQDIDAKHDKVSRDAAGSMAKTIVMGLPELGRIDEVFVGAESVIMFLEPEEPDDGERIFEIPKLDSLGSLCGIDYLRFDEVGNLALTLADAK